jgi:hypothetical protein
MRIVVMRTVIAAIRQPPVVFVWHFWFFSGEGKSQMANLFDHEKINNALIKALQKPAFLDEVKQIALRNVRTAFLKRQQSTR